LFLPFFSLVLFVRSPTGGRFVYGGNKGNGSVSGGGQGRGHNVSMRVVVTLMCVQISPILLSGFVKIKGRGVEQGGLFLG
jgi:hypothetical protein